MSQINFERVLRLFQGNGASRIRREGMPNGCLFDDLIWYGDAGSNLTLAVAGFIVVPGERYVLDEEAQNYQIERLRVLLETCGTEYTVMAKFLVCADFAAELERYRLDTENIEDHHEHRWPIWVRTERLAKLQQAMDEEKLRREVLVVFFSRLIETAPPFSISEDGLTEHYRRLAASESSTFDHVTMDALRSNFPDCSIKRMDEHDLFLYYYRFLNPSCDTGTPEQAFNEGFGAGESLHTNFLPGDLTQSQAGISFELDGMSNIILIMRELPQRMGPNLISHLTDLKLLNFEITVSLAMKDSAEIIKELGKIENQLGGEALTQKKATHALSTQQKMAIHLIHDFESGKTRPVDVFFAIRLWDKNPLTVISQAQKVKNAFLSMCGAKVHTATNAETARNTFYQTFPGWTHSTYTKWNLPTDDWTAAELLPYTASYEGDLDKAEALYTSPKGALVGLTTQRNGVPQNGMVLGVTGSGKTLGLADIISQISPRFGRKLIVEEGLSLGTLAQALGADPIIVSPGCATTINYLDTGGLPLTNELLADAGALCLHMLRENTGPNVSLIQASLTEHINLLYNAAWSEWARLHPEEAHTIAQRACGITRYLKAMKGHANTFLDAWSEVRDKKIEFNELDEGEVARFSTDHKTRLIVRNLGLSYMTPAEMPTHSQLVELMRFTPSGGHNANPLAVEIGKRLRVWNADGDYGQFFDGPTTTSLKAKTTHFDLTHIPDHMTEMRTAVYFLIMNFARQEIITRPREERKLILFEEASRILQMPGGARLLAECYAQMRKFNCVVLTVFQQIAALNAADPAVRAAVRDNTKFFLIFPQPSPQAADEIAASLALPKAAGELLKHYALPENIGGKYSTCMLVTPDARGQLKIGTLRIYVPPEMLYCAASDSKIWDERQKALAPYDDVVKGIILEARKYKKPQA